MGPCALCTLKPLEPIHVEPLSLLALPASAPTVAITVNSKSGPDYFDSEDSPSNLSRAAPRSVFDRGRPHVATRDRSSPLRVFASLPNDGGFLPQTLTGLVLGIRSLAQIELSRGGNRSQGTYCSRSPSEGRLKFVLDLMHEPTGRSTVWRLSY